MLVRRTHHTVFAAVIASALLAATVTPALGQTAAPTVDSAPLERAIEDLGAAALRSARIETRLQEARQDLGDTLAEQSRARDRLSERARVMYRMRGESFLFVLLGARSLQDLAARWTLLLRMSEQDAVDLQTLRTARQDARQAAESLMSLQAEQARALDEAAAEVATARRDLAESRTALAEYEEALAEATEPESAATPDDSIPQLTGSGPWQSALASHYAPSFTGKGASGEPIGPYSMIVAHRTLPFGTLVEFEYQGKRAVASVEDRGPHVESRMWDLGPGVVRVLGFSGVNEVRYRLIDR